MARTFLSFVIIGSALFVVCSSQRVGMVPCRPNEQLDDCGRLCERKCNDEKSPECGLTVCRDRNCMCKPGFERNNETDMCVPPADCPKPKCKVNEILAPCGSQCEGTCEHPSRPEKCKIMFCSTFGCQCDLSRGYVRNVQTGECSRNQDDKKCAAKLQCPRNEESKLCGGICEPTCRNREERQCRIDTANCVINCQCKPGYVRNEVTRECVKCEQCPR